MRQRGVGGGDNQFAIGGLEESVVRENRRFRVVGADVGLVVVAFDFDKMVPFRVPFVWRLRGLLLFALASVRRRKLVDLLLLQCLDFALQSADLPQNAVPNTCWAWCIVYVYIWLCMHSEGIRLNILTSF